MTVYTPAQVAAAYDVLALDHDYTLGVTITPGRVHVTTALLDESGHPVVTGGVLQRMESSYTVDAAPPADPDPVVPETSVEESPAEEAPADEPTPEEVPA